MKVCIDKIKRCVFFCDDTGEEFASIPFPKGRKDEEITEISEMSLCETLEGKKAFEFRLK